MRNPRHPPRARRAATLLALLSVQACAPEPPEPAPFVQPDTGTVYLYGEVLNQILSTEGIRTRYQDHRGRVAERIGLFLTAGEGSPIQVDTAALMGLWPLEPGKTAVVEILSGEEPQEVYEYEFVVQRMEPVETGLGSFDSYVVQGVVTPKLVRNPAVAQTIMNSWWYSPELNAVTRFRTTYLLGPGQGTVVEDRLREILDREAWEARLAEQAADTAGPGDDSP